MADSRDYNVRDVLCPDWAHHVLLPVATCEVGKGCGDARCTENEEQSEITRRSDGNDAGMPFSAAATSQLLLVFLRCCKQQSSVSVSSGGEPIRHGSSVCELPLLSTTGCLCFLQGPLSPCHCAEGEGPQAPSLLPLGLPGLSLCPSDQRPPS